MSLLLWRGTPWRDFELEYAPLEAAMILLIGQGTAAYTGQAVVVLAFVADLVTAVALGIGWRRSVAGRYLLIGLPLLSFIYLRLDAIPVAFTVSGFAFARRRQEVRAALVLAAGILAKLWPIVVMPALLVGRRRHAFALTTLVATIGLVGWVAFAGVDAPFQVVTFRGADGWSAESVVGTVVWIVSSAAPIVEQGAPRVGVIPDVVRIAMALGVFSTLVVVWHRARRFIGDPLGAPALAAVSALLVWSPLFSLQYAFWLTPFLAIAAASRAGRGGAWLAATAVLATGAVALTRTAGPFAGTILLQQSVLMLRNLTVVGIVVWWFATTRSQTRHLDRIV